MTYSVGTQPDFVGSKMPDFVDDGFESDSVVESELDGGY